MAAQNNSNPPTGFWFGFALGTLAIGAGALLFGTKKGRKTVQQFLDFSQNFEENAYLILEDLQEKAEHFVPLIKEELSRPTPRPASGISGLLSRIKFLSPGNNKQSKKYTKTSA